MIGSFKQRSDIRMATLSLYSNAAGVFLRLSLHDILDILGIDNDSDCLVFSITTQGKVEREVQDDRLEFESDRPLVLRAAKLQEISRRAVVVSDCNMIVPFSTEDLKVHLLWIRAVEGAWFFMVDDAEVLKLSERFSAVEEARVEVNAAGLSTILFSSCDA